MSVGCQRINISYDFFLAQTLFFLIIHITMEYTFVSIAAFENLINTYLNKLPECKRHKALINLKLLGTIKTVLLDLKMLILAIKILVNGLRNSFILKKLLGNGLKNYIKYNMIR